MKTKRIYKSGFTLVEIMIVVAIIGLLSAIALPNFIRSRSSAQQNACINNLRQIDGAVQQWALENKAGPSDAVTEDNIEGYMGRGVNIDTILCPAGGAAATTFALSYTIDKVDTAPLCKIGAGFSLPHQIN